MDVVTKRFENFFAKAARLSGPCQDEGRKLLVGDANDDVKLFNIAMMLVTPDKREDQLSVWGKSIAEI